MNKFILVLFCILLSISLGAQQTKDISVSGSRLAVVIGNKNYEHISSLTTTEADAAAIKDVMAELGFEVLHYYNLNRREMDGLIGALVSKLRNKKYEAVLIYYSGHGLQVDGVNYLVPIDADPKTILDVKHQCERADRFLDNLDAFKVPTKIMLLDACRNNPFKGFLKNTDLGGFAWMSTPTGTFLGFAASPGKPALDGSALGLTLSPYTQAIMDHIKIPGLTIDQVFTRVAGKTSELAQRIGKNQDPFKNSSLKGDFYFLPSATSRPATASPPDQDKDGIVDSEDDCPTEYGTAAARGCPEPLDQDKDQDGVPDASDKCPNEKGQQQFQGCPDRDGDNIPDHLDNCPEMAGTPGNDGCPKLLNTKNPSKPKTSSNSMDPLNNMTPIKGGTFNMGSNSIVYSNQGPMHQVQVSDFYLWKHKVTVAEYETFINATAYQTNADKNGYSLLPHKKWGKKFKGVNWEDDKDGRKQENKNNPVIHVSWYDAIMYCNWRSQEEGLQAVYEINGLEVTADWKANGYRLPTEAEWEYAARNIGKDMNEQEGLINMTEGVLEWCWDRFGSYPSKLQQDPKGPAEGRDRVMRGGFGEIAQTYLIDRKRYGSIPDRGRPSIGFRLARSSN